MNGVIFPPRLPPRARLIKTEELLSKCPLCPKSWLGWKASLAWGIKRTWIARHQAKLHLFIEWDCNCCKGKLFYAYPLTMSNSPKE